MPPGREATTREKGHGRIEKRTLRTTPILTAGSKWPGLRQGVEVRRERTVGGVTTTEVAYAATSLSADRADARRLLGLVRNHWRIENQLHYVRDVTLGEDRCRVRSGAAPQVLAALRNAAVHLLATVGAESRPAAIEMLQADLDRARRLIGLP